MCGVKPIPGMKEKYTNGTKTHWRLLKPFTRVLRKPTESILKNNNREYLFVENQSGENEVFRISF